MGRRTQITLDENQYTRLSELSRRSGASMSELIRRAIDRAYQEHRESVDGSFGAEEGDRALPRRLDVEEDIDRRIVEGYLRRPPDDIWGDESARRLIETEPW